MRMFPIISEGKDCPRQIPWSVIQSHEAQAKRNHDQSLEQLAARGGLCPLEAVAVLEDKEFYQRWLPSRSGEERRAKVDEALKVLKLHVELFEKQVLDAVFAPL